MAAIEKRQEVQLQRNACTKSFPVPSLPRWVSIIFKASRFSFLKSSSIELNARNSGNAFNLLYLVVLIWRRRILIK